MKYHIKWVKLIPVYTHGEIEIDELTLESLNTAWDKVADSPEKYDEGISDINDTPPYPDEQDMCDDELWIKIDNKWVTFDKLISELEVNNDQ